MKNFWTKYDGTSATLEIVLMLLGAFLLGALMMWAYDKFLFECIEVDDENEESQRNLEVKKNRDEYQNNIKQYQEKDNNQKDDYIDSEERGAIMRVIEQGKRYQKNKEFNLIDLKKVEKQEQERDYLDAFVKRQEYKKKTNLNFQNQINNNADNDNFDRIQNEQKYPSPTIYQKKDHDLVVVTKKEENQNNEKKVVNNQNNENQSNETNQKNEVIKNVENIQKQEEKNISGIHNFQKKKEGKNEDKNNQKNQKKVEQGEKNERIKKSEKIQREDNLKIIEGIGPKIEKILKSNGILTLSDLAKKTPQELKTVLLKIGGDRYAFHDPTTWPDQAKLASENKYIELKEYQEFLKGGKKV